MYVDPSFGLIIQVVLGTILVIPFMLKIWGAKVKNSILRRRRNGTGDSKVERPD